MWTFAGLAITLTPIGPMRAHSSTGPAHAKLMRSMAGSRCICRAFTFMRLDQCCATFAI